MAGLLKVSDLFAPKGFGMHLCPGKDRMVLKVRVLVLQSNKLLDRFCQCSDYEHLCIYRFIQILKYIDGLYPRPDLFQQ